MHLPNQVTLIFHKRRYYGWQNSILGSDPLEGLLVNSRVPEIAHIFRDMFMCVLLLQACKLLMGVLQGAYLQLNLFGQQ